MSVIETSHTSVSEIHQTQNTSLQLPDDFDERLADFTPDSAAILKDYMLGNRQVIVESECKKTSKKAFEKTRGELYRKMVESREAVGKMFEEGGIGREIKHSSSFSSEYNNSLFGSTYVAPASRAFIKTHTTGHIKFTCRIGGRRFDLVFLLFDGKGDAVDVGDDIYAKYERYAFRAFMWLYIASSYGGEMCAKTLVVYFYLTPAKKALPGNQGITLDSSNCNSAVTTSCTPNGEILVYREEEWFKVFVHECFHVFGLDFSHRDTGALDKRIRTFFPIQTRCNLAESYTECWATLINCMFCSFFLLDSKKSDGENEAFFMLLVDLFVLFEKSFAMAQMKKVLSFMGVELGDLGGKGEISAKRRKMYKENTNVFSYYIVKTLLLVDHCDFLKWCKKHNENTLKFSNNPSKLKDYFQLIVKKYRNKAIGKELDRLVMDTGMPLMRKTMRMTAVSM